jgi:hypothetical protein
MATFSSGAYRFRCFFMRSLLYRTGRTPSPFPTEPEHSLEEDPDIQDMWSRLLASTASSGDMPFYASLIDILKQLSPEEARFLKAVYRRFCDEAERYENLPPDHQLRTENPRFKGVGTFPVLKQLFVEVNYIEKEEDDAGFVVSVALANLHRLRLIIEPGMGQNHYKLEILGLVFLGICSSGNPQSSHAVSS